MQGAKNEHRVCFAWVMQKLDCGDDAGQGAVQVVWTQRWLVGSRSRRATAGYHYMFGKISVKDAFGRLAKSLALSRSRMPFDVSSHS